MEDQLIGKFLDGRYEILERIGTGGMAVVYKARCHKLNRLVAIKILKPELASDEEFRRRFHDESQAVAMLSNPNIVAVYDVAESDGLNYIVMELIDGITLKQYEQRKGGALNWREAVHFTTQILKALSHAHSHGIIHRDIKPQNVMVLRDGSVKVTDFGIARLAASNQKTMTQETLGSVHYISPEQAKGSFIDCRTDIYSTGVVLYEMITGRLPFEGDTPVSVAIQHINSIPLSPRDINPDIPEGLEEITMKAMASNLDKRYASADEMLDDLEEFRKNPEIAFAYEQEDLFVNDEEVDEPTIIREMEAAGVSDEALGGPEDEDADAEEDEEPEGKPKRSVVAIVIGVAAVVLFLGALAYILISGVFGSNGILSGNGEEVIVPNFVGLTLDEANQALASGEIENAKYFVIEKGEDVPSEKPVGQIVSQDPEFNEKKKVAAGDTLTITVDISAGPDTLIMPDLVGQDYRLAQSTLEDTYGVVVDISFVYNDTVDSYVVISTEPAAGTNLTKGQTVTITASRGATSQAITVPNFLNMNIDEAQAQAEEMGLFVQDVQEMQDSRAAGTVIYQSLSAGTLAQEGDTIVFYVSNGQTATTSAEPDTSEEPSAEPSTSTSAEPSAETSTEPSPSQEPSQSTEPDTGGVTVSKLIDVDLRDYTDLEQVTVTIIVDGVTQVNSEVETSVGIYEAKISGKGTQHVSVSINGDEVYSFDEEFS